MSNIQTIRLVEQPTNEALEALTDDQVARISELALAR